MKPSLKLIINHTNSSGAMPVSQAALAPSGLSRSASQAKPPAAIAGPSEEFVRRGRNPDAASAWPFKPTVKREGDIVL